MTIKVKRGLFIIIGLLMLLFIGVFTLDYFIEKKIKEKLSEVTRNVHIQYQKVEVSSFSGSVNLIKPSISVLEKNSNKLIAQIEMEHFTMNGFSYWDYFLYDKIKVDEILFNQIKTIYYLNSSAKSESSKDGILKGLKQSIEIEFINIQWAYVEIYNTLNDSLLLKTENLNCNFEMVGVDPTNKINPLIYNDFKITSNSFFYSLNEYENLILEHLDIRPNTSKLKGITLKTKYSQEELSNQIDEERDHYNLTMDSIEIQKQSFGLIQDTSFFFKSNQINLFQPKFIIYRDKLVVDDLSHKLLCSKLLRDLNFDLTLNSIFLNNASIFYTEKMDADTKGGSIQFTDLKGEIKNLSNTYKSDSTITTVNLNAVFMKSTPVDVHWEFDVNNPQDEFSFKAEIGKINTENMNQFMEPNLNLRLNGEVFKTYFSIYGNNISSHIDLKLKYDDFELVVLKENGERENKFLSKIVNLFISKDSKDASRDFRHGSVSEVERIPNKSIFNYLWLNIKAGLSSAMVGNKEKE